jgi:hypothetical protein
MNCSISTADTPHCLRIDLAVDSESFFLGTITRNVEPGFLYISTRFIRSEYEKPRSWRSLLTRHSRGIIARPGRNLSYSVRDIESRVFRACGERIAEFPTAVFKELLQFPGLN